MLATSSTAVSVLLLNQPIQWLWMHGGGYLSTKEASRLATLAYCTTLGVNYAFLAQLTIGLSLQLFCFITAR